MPGPIDDALKHLTELSPQDWVVRGGWPAAAAALIDADIGTISGAADKAIRVSSTPDWLLAIDFQSGHDSLAKLPDLLLYNSALFKRHRPAGTHPAGPAAPRCGFAKAHRPLRAWFPR